MYTKRTRFLDLKLKIIILYKECNMKNTANLTYFFNYSIKFFENQF